MYELSSVMLSMLFLHHLRMDHVWNNDSPYLMHAFIHAYMHIQLSPPEAWSKVNANRAQRETLQQITDFAAAVAHSGKGEERAYALALIFSLGVSRGSVSDLLQVYICGLKSI